MSELTGFPEMLGGRVKTLHPAVHAGKWFITFIMGILVHSFKIQEEINHKPKKDFKIYFSH